MPNEPNLFLVVGLPNVPISVDINCHRNRYRLSSTIGNADKLVWALLNQFHCTSGNTAVTRSYFAGQVLSNVRLDC